MTKQPDDTPTPPDDDDADTARVLANARRLGGFFRQQRAFLESSETDKRDTAKP